MASPPVVGSPTAISPPYPSPAQLPNKKRTSNFDGHGQQIKRRKASIASQSSGLAHPLRQTSFPPEARSPFARSPSVDTMSHVSGSAVSEAASGVTKGKKKTKSKSKKKGDGSKEATPSVVGGKSGTSVVGQAGDKDAEDEEDDDKAEMAVEDVVARTQEQKQEEIRLRAMLVEAFDPEQYNRYELWRAAKLSDAVVKRVVNATVSQSVPQMVSTAVKAVAKIFAGELIEHAREIQEEWIYAGEEQVKQPEGPRPADDDKGLEDYIRDERAWALAERDKEEGKKTRSGPLRPDHLREAWRRYKLTTEARGVGMQQLWHTQQHTGVERFSTRTRKRMFT